MQLEILEFYPLSQDKERDVLTGTMRVKLSDFGIHILGIFVSKRKSNWYFTMPGRNATHHETGERVRYPFIVFEDRVQHSQLMDIIRVQGPLFIEKRLKDKENPLLFPSDDSTQLARQQTKPPSSQRHHIQAEVASISKKAQARAFPKVRVYRDIPPRSQTSKGKQAKTSWR